MLEVRQGICSVCKSVQSGQFYQFQLFFPVLAKYMGLLNFCKTPKNE